MRSLDLGGDAKRDGVTAANRTEAEEVKIARGEIRSGKAAKIGLISIRVLEPLVVNAIDVHDLRLQAFGFQHGCKAQDADRRKLAHDPGRFHFAHSTAIKLISRGSTDEAKLH